MKNAILKTARSGEVRSVVLGHIIVPNDPPEMILVVGPCRTGTTALGNVFARSGLTSYMQPIKSMRRAIEEGDVVVDWNIDPLAKVVFSKETLGAKTEAEFFDPVEELSKVGYPVDRIHVIGTCRDPRTTLGSWVQMWGNIPLAGFVESFKLVDRILDLAAKRGATTTHYVQEAIGTNDSEIVVAKLLERTGLSNRKSVLDPANWTEGSVFGEYGSNIVFFDTPPDRFVAGVKESNGYQFKLLLPELTRAQEDALRSKGLYDIFGKFAKRCEEDLGIKILED